MSRQQVHAFIEKDTYLALKSQDVNISEMVRNALEAAVDNDVSAEEEELQEKVEADKKLVGEARKRLSENGMKLAIIQEKRQRAEKAYWAEKEKAERMNDALRNSEVMNF